jgi:hypothetical protein
MPFPAIEGYRGISLDFIYGERTTALTLKPPAGELSDGGEGYTGFDSGAHQYTGRLEK